MWETSGSAISDYCPVGSLCRGRCDLWHVLYILSHFLLKNDRVVLLDSFDSSQNVVRKVLDPKHIDSLIYISRDNHLLSFPAKPTAGTSFCSIHPPHSPYAVCRTPLPPHISLGDVSDNEPRSHLIFPIGIDGINRVSYLHGGALLLALSIGIPGQSKDPKTADGDGDGRNNLMPRWKESQGNAERITQSIKLSPKMECQGQACGQRR